VMDDNHQVEDTRREADIVQVEEHILVPGDMHLPGQGSQGTPAEQGSHQGTLHETLYRHPYFCPFHLPCLPHQNGTSVDMQYFFSKEDVITLT
jgi:hypothetical protein